MGRQRRRRAGKGLGGPGLLAFDIAPRHWTLLDREERLSSKPVEQEQVRGLRTNRDGGPVLARKQQRRGSNIVIPQIVMNGLKGPDLFSGRRFQYDDRIGIAIVARAKAAIVVRAGTSGGEEHQTVGLIDDDSGPGVGASRGRVLGKRVKRPDKYAGFRVERADFAGGHAGAAVIGDEGSYDDEFPAARCLDRKRVVN